MDNNDSTLAKQEIFLKKFEQSPEKFKQHLKESGISCKTFASWLDNESFQERFNGLFENFMLVKLIDNLINPTTLH